VAQVAAAMGVRTIYNDVKTFAELALPKDLPVEFVDKATLWRDADVLTVHVDGRAETRNLIDAKVLEATDRYFSPQRKEDLLRSMKDAALSVLAREGEQTALEVAAVMTVIGSSGLITNPPSEVAFLRGFFQKALSLMAARDGGSLRIPVPGHGLPLEMPADAEDAAQAGAAEAPGVAAEASADVASEATDATPSAVDNEW